MKSYLVSLFVLFIGITNAQDHSAVVKKFQDELNKMYHSADHSPLSEKDRLAFKGHDFFEIDDKLRVTAKLVRTPDSESFAMKTSGHKTPTYKQYGIAHFEIDGKAYSLKLLKNQKFLTHPIYKNMLFLPYKDHTNGINTYGGGRYIDLKIPEGDMIVIDFNQSYNPYCAYSDGYNCPIPPIENHIPIAIKAGIKLASKD